jgi:hypothetical protein
MGVAGRNGADAVGALMTDAECPNPGALLCGTSGVLSPLHADLPLVFNSELRAGTRCPVAQILALVNPAVDEHSILVEIVAEVIYCWSQN